MSNHHPDFRVSKYLAITNLYLHGSMSKMYTALVNALRYNVKPFIPLFILSRWKTSYSEKDIKKWRQAGARVPPPHFIKQFLIREYRHKYGYAVLIESGTFLGDMVAAQQEIFAKIISIELDGFLFRKAVRRFKAYSHIRIMYGDSGKIMRFILKDIHEPCLFWLDGHYSSGVTARGEKVCPIFEELEAIFSSAAGFNHVILIDDARLFTGKGGYPQIDELTHFIKSRNNNYQVLTEKDVICYAIP
jgi:hypothetical protein